MTDASLTADNSPAAQPGPTTPEPAPVSAKEEAVDTVRFLALLAVAVLIVPQLAAAFWARKRVTPLADPHTPDGQPAALIPMAQAQQMGIVPGAERE